MTGVLALLVVNFALVVWGAVTQYLLQRRLRHVAQLDALLALLCIQCFMRQSQPIWHAWTLAMGDISVEVKQTRHSSEDRP